MDSGTQEASFSDTPTGWAQRIAAEFSSARKALEEWHKEALESIRAYLNEKGPLGGKPSRFSVYTADTQTQEAILFGNPPKVTVTRRYADAQDDIARVAGEIQERLLNAEIEGHSDTLAKAVGHAHWERQVPGFGLCKVRYDIGETEIVPGQDAKLHPETGAELSPAVPPTERRPNEQVETDWVHWNDALWGACRVPGEIPWMAFASDISRKQASKRFGDEVANALPVKGRNKAAEESKAASPWDRIRLWEVWMKEEELVFFFVEGAQEVLSPVGIEVAPNGGQPDPLGLEGFFPCPTPMMANLTTSKLVPKPDYALHKPLYEDIDRLARRIAILEDSLKLRGAYNKDNIGLKQLLADGDNAELVPVDNWATFTEKGGLAGAVSWLPLEQIAATITALQGRMTEKVDQLRQLTGMADIMRGQAEEGGATATEQRIKARFGSVRMTRRQKELASFVSDLQRLRAEVMAKQFDESTYLARCNCENTPDADKAVAAIQFLKSNFAKYRIEVKPETISMTDFDALKRERTEMVGAIAEFMTAAAPISQAVPGSMPYLLQILQWLLAALPGASEIEAVIDQAIASAEQMGQQQQGPQQPDPKIVAQQLKNQGDMAKVQAELQADVQREQVKVQADAQREQDQATWNVREAEQKHAIVMADRALNPKPNGGAE